MKNIICLLLVMELLIQFANAQETQNVEHINNAVFSCDECDSLYNLVCYPRDTLIYGEDVDGLPEYPGGLTALKHFIEANTQYPQAFKKINFQGVVVVHFIIDETGKVICPRVILSLYPEFDAEALRVVQLLPRWHRAWKDYESVKFCYTVPVFFSGGGSRRWDYILINPDTEE